MKTVIIVPCRLESTRFPRKLLHEIFGKPLILWVAERIAAEAPELPAFFAVDDVTLERPLVEHGFKTIMTDKGHVCGTDRIAEANQSIGATHIINVQADEPLVTGKQIRALEHLIHGDSPMATLCTRFRKAKDFMSPSQVKVVLTEEGGKALFFSRSPLPFARALEGKVDDQWVQANPCYRHLGLYAYQQALLAEYPKLPPGRLEQIEKLEQLRALERGYDITCGVTDDMSIGIDTPDDAFLFENALRESRSNSV